MARSPVRSLARVATRPSFINSTFFAALPKSLLSQRGMAGAAMLGAWRLALVRVACVSSIKGLVDLHPAANSANASASAASSNAKAAAKRVKVYALASYESDPEWALVRT